MTLGTPLVKTTSTLDSTKTTPSRPPETVVHRHKLDRRTRRLVFGLTGVLGVTWAVVIAGRYSGFLGG